MFSLCLWVLQTKSLHHIAWPHVSSSVVVWCLWSDLSHSPPVCAHGYWDTAVFFSLLSLAGYMKAAFLLFRCFSAGWSQPAVRPSVFSHRGLIDASLSLCFLCFAALMFILMDLAKCSYFCLHCLAHLQRKRDWGGGGEADLTNIFSPLACGWTELVSLRLVSICPRVLLKQVIIKAITVVLGKQAPLTHSRVI